MVHHFLEEEGGLYLLLLGCRSGWNTKCFCTEGADDNAAASVVAGLSD